ncbi:prophage regulatory protein [Inquilinus ginsengisoli]|uniref:Prophage regulatory protein n=1 Tax=Inquilinus ginsengisoli TaxID=363840 RepID=A0ABU1JJ33_9PROT|nr:prophage regulatory protein [Inquilinus ginsengisoli]
MQILKIDDTAALTSLSQRHIHRLSKDGKFPKPIRLSPARIGWRQADVVAWLETRGEA